MLRKLLSLYGKNTVHAQYVFATYQNLSTTGLEFPDLSPTVFFFSWVKKEKGSLERKQSTHVNGREKRHHKILVPLNGIPQKKRRKKNILSKNKQQMLRFSTSKAKKPTQLSKTTIIFFFFPPT